MELYCGAVVQSTMRIMLSLTALVLLVVSSRPCMGEIVVENVSKARAKELGIDLTATANGPKQAWIKLEFKLHGELKDFQHVSLEIRNGDQFLLGWTPLKDTRSNSDSVVVGLLANRVFLENVTLRVVTGATGDVGHDLRVKDFVDLKILR